MRVSEHVDASGNMLSSLKHTLRSSSNPAGGIADAPVAKLKISQKVTGTKPSKGKVGEGGGGGGGGEEERERDSWAM